MMTDVELDLIKALDKLNIIEAHKRCGLFFLDVTRGLRKRTATAHFIMVQNHNSNSHTLWGHTYAIRMRALSGAIV